MDVMVVKNRDIRSTAAFSPLVNRQVPSKIRKLVSIVQMFGKKEDKPYLFFNCDRPSVKIVEYATWVAKAQSAINNTCKLALEHWDTKQKLLCLEK